MRRGLTTFTTPRAAITSVALCAGLFALALLGAAFPALNVVITAHSVMPFLLMLTGAVAGFAPMSVCTLIALAALGYAGGGQMLLYGVLYLLPMFAAYWYGMTRRVHFWVVCAAVCGALFLSQVVIYGLLLRMSGGDLYTFAANAAVQAVQGMPARDSLLYLLHQAGLLSLPQSMAETALVPLPGGEAYALAPEALDELLKQVRSLVSTLLRGVMPSLLVSGSATTGVAGVALSIHFGRKAAQRRAFKRNEEPQDIPTLSMPPFSAWYIPRPWGKRIGVLAAGYLLMSFSSGDALYMAGALLWQVFGVCFGLQGLATINFSQKKRASRKGWRVAVIVLACLLRPVQIAMIFVGVAEQFSNLRGLRPAKAPRGDE